MKIAVTCALLLSLMSTGNAAERPSSTVIDKDCIQNPADPFDLGWRMSYLSEKFAEKCLDTSTKRSADVLTEDETQITFANFFHQGQYWKATWNKTDLPKADFLIVHFDSGVPLVTAGHTEIRFRFEQGLELVSQTTGERSVVNDLIVDWEASFVKGESYNMMTGLNNNYALAGRILSTESRIPENIVSAGKMRKIDQYSMALPAQSAADLFLTSVRRSDQRGMNYFYLTLDRNCTTEPFAVIDEVLNTAGMMPKGVQPLTVGIGFDPIVGPSRSALVERKLIERTAKAESFANEFGFAEEK